MEARGRTDREPRLAIPWEQNPSKILSGTLSLTSCSFRINEFPIIYKCNRKMLLFSISEVYCTEG